MHIELPNNVKTIIKTLEEAGYEAYAVGGCVRDSILGRVPNDWDITTCALPLQTKALFKKTFDTGIQHGTISILLDKEIYEVTTFRIDGEYEDSRHPKEVTFTANLKEDLLRRDFTINAMAYNDTVGLVDLYGGLDDVKNKTIRCVGKAHDRFSEDALRILRAIRFAAQLDYDIEKETKDAIKDLAENLKNISVERIQAELTKIMTSDHPEYIRLAYELGVTKVFLEEFDVMMQTGQNNPHHCYSVGEHTLRVLSGVRNDKVLRYAALFHDIGKPASKTTDENGIDHFKKHPYESEKITEGIMKRLKFDNDTIHAVCRLVVNHDWVMTTPLDKVRRAVNRIGEEAFPMIFELNLADMLAQSDYEREEKMDFLEKLRASYKEIVDNNQCISLKTLAVKGADLIEAGIKPGPEIGEILSRMLDVVLEDPQKNTKEELMKLLEV